MTSENKKLNIKEEISRGDESFHAAEILSREGQKFREESDYKSGFVFTEEDAKNILKNIQEFQKEVLTYLKKEKLFSPST